MSHVKNEKSQFWFFMSSSNELGKKSVHIPRPNGSPGCPPCGGVDMRLCPLRPLHPRFGSSPQNQDGDIFTSWELVLSF